MIDENTLYVVTGEGCPLCHPVAKNWVFAARERAAKDKTKAIVVQLPSSLYVDLVSTIGAHPMPFVYYRGDILNSLEEVRGASN